MKAKQIQRLEYLEEVQAAIEQNLMRVIIDGEPRLMSFNDVFKYVCEPDTAIGHDIHVMRSQPAGALFDELINGDRP